MNIQVRTLALHVLLSPLICFTLTHDETGEPTTPIEHSIHPRTPFIRDLNDDGAAFSDDKSYFSNDETFDQMLRLSTSTITNANPRNGEEDNSVNVVEYLSRPNTLESLANSINAILTIPAIYDNDDNVKDKNQERQDVTAQVLNESVDLALFFGVSDAKAFPVFSYNYDTMPPTTNKQTESPAPTPEISSTTIASTGSAEPTDDPAPTVATAADDDLLIINKPMDSAIKFPTPLPASSAVPFSSSRENQSANTDGNLPLMDESNGLPVARPQEQIIATNNDIAQSEEVVHSPSLRPSVSISAAMDDIDSATCFPPCKEIEEICRSGGKGGFGSCYPKCKSKKQKYYTSKMEIEEHGRDKYADGKGRRMLGRDTDNYPANERRAKIKEKGSSKSDTSSRTVRRRRRLRSNDIPA